MRLNVQQIVIKLQKYRSNHKIYIYYIYMFKGIQKILNSNAGKYIISILLGIGLSTIFRNACEQRKCIVFKAVDPGKIKDHIFKIDKNCFKFTHEQIKCSDNNDEITF